MGGSLLGIQQIKQSESWEKLGVISVDGWSAVVSYWSTKAASVVQLKHRVCKWLAASATRPNSPTSVAVDFKGDGAAEEFKCEDWQVSTEALQFRSLIASLFAAFLRYLALSPSREGMQSAIERSS